MNYVQSVVVAINAVLAGGLLYVWLTAAGSSGARSLSGARRVTGNILIYLAGFVLLFSGSLKLSHLSPVVAEMESLRLTGWKLWAVGSLEIATGLAFLAPPVRSIGLLVISSYMGGAICAHLASDQLFAILPATFVLGCCWLGVSLRHPQVLWSLSREARVREIAPRPAFANQPSSEVAS